MSLIISRPSGVNVGVRNPGDTIYVKGSEFVDGSARFRAAEAAEPLEIFAEERIDGVWTLAPLISWEPNVDRDTATMSIDRETGEESRAQPSSHED